MLSDKPRLGIAFSLVAGILMLIVWVGALHSEPIQWIELMELGYVYWGRSVAIIRLCFVIGWAVLILIGGLVLYITPKQHSLGGVIILTISTLTMLLWTGGFIVRHLVGIYGSWWSPYLWRISIDGLIGITPFDVLAVASIFGIIGGISGVLWKTNSTIASVKQSEAKRNLLGVASAIMSFNSLALPWWVWLKGTDYFLLFPWGDEVVAAAPPGWRWKFLNTSAIQAALAFILISGILVLVGSLVVGKRGRILLVVAGIFAVLSIGIFAVGLESSPIIWYPGVPRIFYSSMHAFYPSDRWLAYLSFGFWTALVAAILAFIASLKCPLIPSKTVSSQEMQA
ncbi:MAG: hypothetical protein OEY99_08080 [Aigarchaeota archaeon]|nr:hypothetical protein [Hadesarchaea archaeon]MDH5704160.1 hypothetical protein [Aigarchaeota archaeon]